MKQKQLVIDAEFLIRLFGATDAGDLFEVTNPVPGDATIIGCHYDMFTNRIHIALHSDQFEDAKEGDVLPQLNVTVRRKS